MTIELLEQARVALRQAGIELAESSLSHRKASQYLEARRDSNAAGCVDGMVESINVLLKALKPGNMIAGLRNQFSPVQEDVKNALISQGAKPESARIAVCRAIVNLPTDATFEDLWRKALEGLSA